MWIALCTLLIPPQCFHSIPMQIYYERPSSMNRTKRSAIICCENSRIHFPSAAYAALACARAWESISGFVQRLPSHSTLDPSSVFVYTYFQHRCSKCVKSCAAFVLARASEFSLPTRFKTCFINNNRLCCDGWPNQTCFRAQPNLLHSK